MGEDVYTPGIRGGALRKMKNPRRASSYALDWYPKRYHQGSWRRGGVSWNSGIANLAFLPPYRGRLATRESLVVVKGIRYQAAAEIIYQAANVNCLTPSSTFYTARYCTADVNGGECESNVHAAWDGVGVPREQARPSPIAPPANWEHVLFPQTNLHSTDTIWKITDDDREV
jgi:Zn-dependent metalloprotease